MILKIIADSGSTKIDWRVLTVEGLLLKSFQTRGINVLLASENDMLELFRTLPLDDNDGVVGELYFYGAGCATEEVCESVKRIAESVWPELNKIEVESDLLGAARALFGNGSGIACILGTGSNSGLYKDNRIVKNIPSLGYILGDEGSGAALGKRLISDACKGQLPESIRDTLFERYNLSIPVILNKIYRRPGPNGFLASFVPFIKENIWNPYIYALVYKEFKKFMRRNVGMYEGARSLDIGFVGSIAVEFEDVLKDVARSTGLQIGKILRGPADGLVSYHSSQNPKSE